MPKFQITPAAYLEVHGIGSRQARIVLPAQEAYSPLIYSIQEGLEYIKKLFERNIIDNPEALALREALEQSGLPPTLPGSPMPVWVADPQALLELMFGFTPETSGDEAGEEDGKIERPTWH